MEIIKSNVNAYNKLRHDRHIATIFDKSGIITPDKEYKGKQQLSRYYHEDMRNMGANLYQNNEQSLLNQNAQI